MVDREDNHKAQDDPKASTQDLVARAVNGDQDAISSLYHLYERDMIAMVHARLGQTLHGLMESVDLVQSVWTDVLLDIKDFEYRGPDSFSRWLRTCLANKIHAKRRYHIAGKRDSKKLKPYPATEVGVGGIQNKLPGPSPSQVLMRGEELEQLMHILERLPDLQRRVLIYRMRDEMKYGEISRKIGKSVGASKKIYNRGLKKLIEQLPKDWEVEDREEESGQA